VGVGKVMVRVFFVLEGDSDNRVIVAEADAVVFVWLVAVTVTVCCVEIVAGAV